MAARVAKFGSAPPASRTSATRSNSGWPGFEKAPWRGVSAVPGRGWFTSAPFSIRNWHSCQCPWNAAALRPKFSPSELSDSPLANKEPDRAHVAVVGAPFDQRGLPRIARVGRAAGTQVIEHQIRTPARDLVQYAHWPRPSQSLQPHCAQSPVRRPSSRLISPILRPRRAAVPVSRIRGRRRETTITRLSAPPAARAGTAPRRFAHTSEGRHRYVASGSTARGCGSSGRTRTFNLAVNSRPLYQLSYRGIQLRRAQRSAANVKR